MRRGVNYSHIPQFIHLPNQLTLLVLETTRSHRDPFQDLQRTYCCWFDSGLWWAYPQCLPTGNPVLIIQSYQANQRQGEWISLRKEAKRKKLTPIWKSFCTPVAGITGEAPEETSPWVKRISPHQAWLPRKKCDYGGCCWFEPASGGYHYFKLWEQVILKSSCNSWNFTRLWDRISLSVRNWGLHFILSTEFLGALEEEGENGGSLPTHVQKYWSGLPFPPPEHLPDPGTEPLSLMSPALVARFFTTSSTREAQVVIYKQLSWTFKICSIPFRQINLLLFLFSKKSNWARLFFSSL